MQVVVKIDVHTITYQQLVYEYTTLIVLKLHVAEALYNDPQIATTESGDRVLLWRASLGRETRQEERVIW